MDLREFYAAYRSDGWGAAAYDPGMMVAILLYAYCLGLRSSRRIARALEEDVGFRVVAADRQPDFRTVCCLRAEQEEALEELFVEVLRLCHEAGLVKLGEWLLVGRRSLSHRPVGELTNTGVGAMGLKRGRPVQFHRPLVGPQKGRLPLLVP